MKTLIFISLIFLASCAKEARQSNKPTKPNRGNEGSATTALVNLTATSFADSIVLSWDAPTLAVGEIIKWTFVNRKYTDPSGAVLLATDGYGLPIAGSEVQTINTGYQYQGSYTTWTVKDSYFKGAGSYEFYVTGSYGDYSTSLFDTPFITNTVFVTVP